MSVSRIGIDAVHELFHVSGSVTVNVYSMPTLGTTEHLKNPRISKMYEFFYRWYVPGNMVIALAGDFDTAEAIGIIERHFGAWEAKPVPERELLKRLRKTIFTDVQKLDPRTVVLVSLAHRSGLLKVTFDKKRLKERKARIERIVSGDLTGHAAKAAIEAMQAAAMVAVMVATTVTR